MRILYTKLQSYSLCYRQTNYMQKIPSVTRIIYMLSVKTTTYVSNRFNTSFCTKDHKTHLAISCYTLLRQVARGEGKNSLRKLRDILVSDRDQQRFFIIDNLILIYDVLSSCRLYYVQFKEVKDLWGRPDNPNTLFVNYFFILKKIQIYLLVFRS